MGNGVESLGDDCDLSVSKEEKTPARRRQRPNEPAIRTAIVTFLREKRKEKKQIKLIACIIYFIRVLPVCHVFLFFISCSLSLGIYHYKKNVSRNNFNFLSNICCQFMIKAKCRPLAVVYASGEKL